MQRADVKRENADPALLPSTACHSGFLIDPAARTITPHSYNGDWRTIAPALGDNVDTFDVVRLEDEDGNSILDVFVDDEGLFKRPRHFFTIDGLHQLYAGRGLVLAADGEGNTIAAKVMLEDLRANVLFCEVLMVEPAIRFAVTRANDTSTTIVVTDDELTGLIGDQLVPPHDPDATRDAFVAHQKQPGA